MNPRIEISTYKKLIGKRIEMSFSKDKTFELWRTFMPRLKEINNKIGSDLYSIEIYDSQFFNNFVLNHGFVKWAAIEVIDFYEIPHGLEPFELSGGLYAVFTHHGPASNATETYQFIFEK